MLLKMNILIIFISLTKGNIISANEFTTNFSPIEWRIIGGSEAPSNAYSYHVELMKHPEIFIGAGTIINSNTILTAAHCVYTINTSTISVYTGSNKLKNGQKYLVKQTIIHQNFSSNTKENDIAILKLKTNIIYSQNVDQIIIGTWYVGGGVKAIVSGWGANKHSGTTINKLQYVVLTTITNEECQKHFGSALQIFNSQLCTYPENKKGACNGDSGGPLVAYNKLIGIVSWERPCAVGYPDVFTRVSSYINWIKEHTS